jgi:hypothetical protein
VPVSIEWLIHGLTVPAFVQNKYMDVLVANRLAVALSPHMAPGVNRLRALFTGPEAARLHPDWEQGHRGRRPGRAAGVPPSPAA